MDGWRRSQARSGLLGAALIRSARRHPWRLALIDQLHGPVRFLGALTGTIALARALRLHWGTQQRVGILLPPSVGGALVNFAAAVTGRVTVNLNYAAGNRGIEMAARTAGLETVVTSRMFVRKANLELPRGVAIVWLEDVTATIGTLERLVCLALAAGAPSRVIVRAVHACRRAGPDDDSTVVFSSGSTGRPKGVRLSHRNVASNVRAAQRVLGFGAGDRLVHVLPLFHAFGNFMLWAGVESGAALILIPNPLDATSVGTMVERYRGTMLCATPTLLQHYRRGISAEKFSTLRIVVSGAEKLSGPIGAAFEAYFGKEILEGYGCTECSPVIAVNSPAPGGSKRGSVGRPLPGVDVRVVDPETFAARPSGRQGLLIVRGPNVMRGYLDRTDLTAGAVRDAWYRTGDIASVDEDGFITISDRLARFSKIGGEMVSHGMIEEALHSVVEGEDRLFVVTAVADRAKGERLAVVHVYGDDGIQDLCRSLKEQGMPNLFIPKPRDFVRVHELPALGTGKIDLCRVRRIASEQQRRTKTA